MARDAMSYEERLRARLRGAPSEPSTAGSRAGEEKNHKSSYLTCDLSRPLTSIAALSRTSPHNTHSPPTHHTGLQRTACPGTTPTS